MTYKLAILRHYKQQMANGQLPLQMHDPTPAGVKEYLLQYLRSHYDTQKDAKIMEGFFGFQEDIVAYAKVVERMDVDKFRPVIKFLKVQTDNPDDKQVHLAALLVDFERPYVFGKDYSSYLNGGGDIGLPPREKPKDNKGKWWKLITLKQSMGYCLFVSVLVFLWFSLNSVSEGYFTGKQCMYWKGDRYIAVACDVRLNEDLNKVALDTFVLNNFRMVTKPDTITEYSVGKLWYLKYQKRFYFFTARGKHPIYQKQLHRLSQYIYENELKSKQ